MRINIDGFKTIVRRNNSYHELIDDNVKILAKNINYLNNEYGGESLQFLFDDLQSQVNDVNFISSVFKNYSDVLLDVLTTYQLLDQYTKTQIEQESRKLL